MEDIRSIVIVYQEKLRRLQTLTKQTKETQEECRNVEELLISTLSSETVSTLITDTATLHIVHNPLTHVVVSKL